jgi:PAS domain S-box-containing protein
MSEMERQDGVELKIADLERKNQELQARLAEAEDTLRAISTGQVDALIVPVDGGERIYTLQGAETAYRLMIESIHEGAAALSADGTILYCNKHLAHMLERPLEQVLSSSIYAHLLPEEREEFSTLIERGLLSFARAEFYLARERSGLPVLVTAAKAEVNGRPAISLVLTDLSEQKQAVAREKELQQRLAGQSEEQRARIARNLHDGPVQELIALSFLLQEMISREQAMDLGKELPALRESILKLTGDLRGVCNELRPSHTIRFGLARAIHYQCEEFQTRYPNVNISQELAEDGQSLSEETRTALYRIVQECLNNTIRHARARQIVVRLFIDPHSLLLEVKDDGVGFTPPEDWLEFARHGHLGLVGMRERAEAIGGRLEVTSSQGLGTLVQVEIRQPIANQ